MDLLHESSRFAGFPNRRFIFTLSIENSLCITKNAPMLAVLFGGVIERWWRTWRPMSQARATGWFVWQTKSKDCEIKS
jgi:hypothetical protein